MHNLSPKQTGADDLHVKVDLGAASYEIRIGEGLIDRAGGLIAPLLSRPFAAIVTDDNVAPLHLERLENALQSVGVTPRSIVVPQGEATKSYAALADLCDKLLAAGVERSDHVIAFGGGVVGDLAGFAAAVLRRGVDFVQIPTTLLAQVDSSVGGKTGINSPLGKNLVGAFHQPALVIADIGVLDTLPPRQLAAGYAEVAKYGLIGDAEFFEWLENSADGLLAGNAQSRMRAIETSCVAKAEIVAEDEREHGQRALLNLGHTFGHALEAATGYSDRLLHGEGVSVGMVLAHRFSEQLGLCPAGTSDRVQSHLAGAGLPVTLSDIPGKLPPAEQLLDIMYQDKKARMGKLAFILTRGIGKAFVEHDVDPQSVLQFLERQLAEK